MTPKIGRSTKRPITRRCGGLLLTTVAIVAIAVAAQSAAAQENVQYTSGTADQTLRSNGRVNPSSLALEMEIPLGKYPGRGITLPLGLSYSSKQWRLEEFKTIPETGGTKTWAIPRYSEDAAAGWTSSLSQPYIEYTGEKYRFGTDGRPLSQEEVVAPPAPAPGNSYVPRITIHLPSGSYELLAQEAEIGLWPNEGPPDPSVWNATFYATDGSGVKYVENSSAGLYRLYLTDGSYWDFSSTRESKSTADTIMKVRRGYRLTDVNGNYVQFNAPTTNHANGSWTDQLNRTFPIMVPRETPVLEPGQTTFEQTLTMPGMTAPYVFIWKQLKGPSEGMSAFTPGKLYDTKYLGGRLVGSGTLAYTPSLFGATTEVRCAGSSSNVLAATPDGQKFNPVVLTEIVLPNQASYRFTYNEYGEIEQIHYPTGGYEEVGYEVVPSLAELTGLYRFTNRGVTQRKIYDDVNDQEPDNWTFSAESSANNYRTSFKAPDLTQVDRFMHRGLPPLSCGLQSGSVYYGNRLGYDNALAGRPYEERSFSSTGALVQQTLTRWGYTESNVVMKNPSTKSQRNARILWTESITYEGNSGVSTVSKLQYDTDVDDLGAPANVVSTTQFAYKGVTRDPNIIKEAAPPAAAVVLADPTVGMTAVRKTETVYLHNDPAYLSKKASYLAKNFVSLPTKTFVKNGAGTITAAKSEISYDDATFSDPYCGHPTIVRNWLDTTGAWIETKTRFDGDGNVIESIDGNGNSTLIEYDPTYNAFPVKTKSPIPDDGTHGSNQRFETVTDYNLITGQVTKIKDPNGLETIMQYIDPLLRPTRVASYDNTGVQVGAATETVYGDGTDENTRFVKIRSQINETSWKDAYTRFDGLGRTVTTQQVDPDGDVFVNTAYDHMGRAYSVTNPYRNGETVYKTENTFDTAGRPWKVTTPDGAVVETTYGVVTTGGNVGTWVTVKDQAGKLRRSVTNALGQLTRFDEPNSGGLGSPDGPTQPTFYTYDLLHNLIQVQQPGDNNEECGPSTTFCSQTRDFEYDSLSRLKRATNPESGTIEYGYDANSNLTTKIDARLITTTMAYDGLNRVKTRVYTNQPPGSETPDVSYFYDNLTYAKGKLIKVTNGVGDNRSTTEYTEFDILGRVKAHKQTTDNNVYTTGYEYNLAGALIEETYPSGRVVKNTLDSNGDLMAVLGRKSSHPQFWAYANNFSYSAAGAMTSMQLGNGLWESTKFNERLQPTQIALGATAPSVSQGQTVYSTDLLKLEYQYGDLEWDGSVRAGSNNGNVAKQTITVQGVGATPGFTAVQNYDYDSLSRIQIASETLTPTTGTPETWVQEFEYDRYGNRTFKESTTTTLPKECGGAVCPNIKAIVNPSANPSNNKLNGYIFDGAGNTTRDAQDRKFTYDAENKQTKVETVSGTTVTGTIGEYWYDGYGKRIKKRAYVSNVATEETIFVYDATGKLVGEYSNQAASSQDAEVAYLTNDHLGSPRINTDFNGKVTARHDFRPFGEEIEGLNRVSEIGYSADNIRKKFTGYERDAESGLDNATARYLRSGVGRFMSPDYFGNDTHGAEPQSWNLYVYVRNNPLKYIDPNGKEVWVSFRGEDGKSVIKLKLVVCVDENGDVQLKFQTEDGKEYAGNSSEVANGLELLRQVYISDAGDTLVDLARNNQYFGLSLIRDEEADPTIMPGLTFAGSDGRNPDYTFAGVSYNPQNMEQSVQALGERILMAAEIQNRGVSGDTNSEKYLAEREAIRKEIYEGIPRIKTHDSSAPPPPASLLRKTLHGTSSEPFPPCNEGVPPPPAVKR